MANNKYIRWFDELGSKDVPIVGGKNANLGEMVSTLKKEGIPVPYGFATTSDAYRRFIEFNKLDEKIGALMKEIKKDLKSLEKVGSAVRKLFISAEFPEDLSAPMKQAYKELSKRYNASNADVAVRSSATAEDLPDASFARPAGNFPEHRR